jgi:TadE-like protein.
MRRLRAEECGGITVETALTLPLVLLLTVGGVLVLLWLHHKTWLQVLVAETARERAADATWTGYYKDIRDSVRAPDSSLVLADARLVSFHLPTTPPAVVVGGCATPAGRVPDLAWATGASSVDAPGGDGADADSLGDDWLQPVRALRAELARLLRRAETWVDGLEEVADAGVTLGEQAVWYRRVGDNLLSGEPARQRLAAEYLAGGVMAEVARLRCQGEGGAVLTAKVVIRGEQTYGQR